MRVEGGGVRGQHSFMMSARDSLGRNNGGLRGGSCLVAIC